jgi:AsmA protein
MKKLLIVLGAVLGLLILAGIAIIFLVDVNAYKPRIEAAVSDALGMEFRIQGKAGLRLLPSVSIVLSDIRLRNLGTDLAAAETLRVGVKLRPLLSRRLEITEIVLKKPVIRIEKGTDGKLNYETPPRSPKPPAMEGKKPGFSLAVTGGAIQNGSLVYLDKKDGAKTEVSGIDLSLKSLFLTADPDTPLSKGISFTGALRVKGIRGKSFAVSDVEANVTASAGVYDIRPLTMKLFGGSGEGGIRIDLSQQKPVFQVKYALAKFRAEESLAAISQQKILSGPMTVGTDLSFRGGGADEMKRTVRGQVSLRGEDLTLHGMDIDGTLSTVEQAHQMNLADVGALLLVGPLEAMVTKGYRFGGVDGASAKGGESELTVLVSEWTIRDGVAEAKDVAFATRKNRIALKGKLDIGKERFVDVTVAVLDEKGCAKIRQTISGPFSAPQLDKVSTLESAVVAILGLFEQTKHLLSQGECTPFYAGSVAQPK